MLLSRSFPGGHCSAVSSGPFGKAPFRYSIPLSTDCLVRAPRLGKCTCPHPSASTCAFIDGRSPEERRASLQARLEKAKREELLKGLRIAAKNDDPADTSSSPVEAGSSSSPPDSQPPVYVFWDLDNKYPLVLDHRRLVERLRTEAAALGGGGRVAEVRAYCNFRTLNIVPELWQQAVRGGMQHPLRHKGTGACRCPLCGHRASSPQLQRHFKQVHMREHSKILRSGHKPSIRKYRNSSKFKKVLLAQQEVQFRKLRGYDLQGLLAAAGVAVRAVDMGRQRADEQLQQEAR
ncbi:hypothetical protein Agub_g5424, partial [Astrephomene gubernaculifera]